MQHLSAFRGTKAHLRRLGGRAGVRHSHNSPTMFRWLVLAAPIFLASAILAESERSHVSTDEVVGALRAVLNAMDDDDDVDAIVRRAPSLQQAPSTGDSRPPGGERGRISTVLPVPRAEAALEHVHSSLEGMIAELQEILAADEERGDPEAAFLLNRVHSAVQMAREDTGRTDKDEL